MRRFPVFLAVLSLVFMFGCGNHNSSETTTSRILNDEDSDGDNDDIEASDIDISDEDPDNPQEPDEKDDSDDIDISDIEISDEDSDNPQEPEDNDNPETPDSDTDTDTPVNPDAAENHKISGAVQAGNATAVAMYECGGTDKIAEANTDANGKFSFKADITAAKTYCVKAGDFASCFKGLSDHVANISEITTAAYLLDKNCEDLRKSETKVRIYAKLGTGKWLGELDYSGLSGIKDGLRLLSSFLNTNDSKTISEKIAADIQKTDGREFEKFFDGFRVLSDKTEIVVGEAADSSVLFSVEGGSTEVADGFRISWTVKNKSSEAATYRFTTSAPGEYVARAGLVFAGDPIMAGNPAVRGGDPIMGGDPVMLSQDSATIFFLQRKSGGTIYVSDMSEDISHYIDNGIYAVIPKNTDIRKNGNRVNTLSYNILSAGEASQISRIEFTPAGTVFSGDSMYFIHDLGTVFGGDPIMLSATRTNADGTGSVLQSAGGDPIMLAAAGDPIMFSAAGDPIMQIARSAGGNTIMQSAAGDPIMTNAAGDPIMNAAAGDPIMNAAAGDPIMTSAAGDPIMASAAGDPIMMGTSSSVMVSKTGHFSTFTVESASLPVSVQALVARWCDGSFYRGYTPLEFIRQGVETYKPAGDEKGRLLSYLNCENFGELGSDLYELINRTVGYNRNLNLFENLFFVSEFYNRMNAKRENGEVAAVRNGLELRSAIAALYTLTTSFNRSATLADLFDSSRIPLTYSGVIPEDYTSKAKAAIAGTSDSDRYIAGKKDMMIFANYITTSSKGPDFSSVSAVLNPDQLVCAWMNPDTLPRNCSKVYTLNEAGHVALGGTEVSVAEANAVFTKFFMPFNSRLSNEEKLGLFRTFYLALKYAGTIFYNGSEVEELNEKLLETAYLVFDGIDGSMNAVSITDTFDASAHTVSVLDGAEMAARPYITKLSALTDTVSLKVAESADVEKLLIRIEGYEFEKVQENTRTYYKPKGSLKEKSIILTPGVLSTGLKHLKELLGSENVDELGNITGTVTIAATSKISGKTYTTSKSYDFFASDNSDGVNSKPVPADIQIFVNDSTGHAIPENAEPMVILNPGNRVFYPENGVVSVTDLAPAAYTVDAVADGYYAKSVSVNVPSGATFGVEIRLDEELVSTADANLELSININTVKHPSKVYIQIYNDDMDLVANEAAKFNDDAGKYETLDIALNSGRYTLLAVGEDMYNYIEAVTLYEGSNTREITVVAKNACGNGIVDSAEECEPMLSEPVLCGDIYPSAPNPDKYAACNPETCTFNKTECGKLAVCGDGILDESEGCDGGAKDCSEIAGFGNAKGTAPCKNDDCSGYITANNCSKATESCGDLPANALWNDGSGRFTQIWNGSAWAPSAQTAKYGLTKDECTFSCTKGYRWNGSACLENPISLALVCTGETDCFDNSSLAECPAYGQPFFGQDAQYAETGYCTQRSLETSGSGDEKTLKDAFTHYEWQKTPGDPMNWAAADTFCMQSAYAGKTDWRLPSPSELLTIVDSGSSNPALGDIFSANGHTFWSTEDAKQNGNAWRVDENGALTSVAKTTKNSVICVRTNDYDSLPDRFSATADTVKDSASGLMWQKQAVASRTWAEALSYCGEVSTGDKFDWRLPNRNELASLIDYTRTDGAMSDFPAIAAKGFWTSTSSVSEAAEAWAVDFESGAIEAAEKTGTKYVICVRNDEPCLGGECADPCGLAPCKNTANSTGLCTADDYSFTCGCKSGFNWNYGKCLLDTTRYIACTGLPENAIWNTVFGISQSYDGNNWYPSEVGTFNKIASSTECRFICATNYKWDADEEKCLPVSRMANCSEKKPYSDWNVVSKISQTWDGEKWIPSSTSEYNEESSEEECRFVCKEHYIWNDENKLCDPETQPATCIGLPANAHWWNEDASITQTWTNGGWAPAATGAHSTDAEENRCFFTCDANYEWNDTSCVAKSQTVNCDGLPDNADWTGGFSSIKQTWNGSEWFPSNVGSYNIESNSAYCRFKCKDNYNWNGTTCVAATQIAGCTGLIANAQWNTVSSIKQTFINGNWMPSTTASYNEEAADSECRFKCKEHYEWKDGECKAGTKPANACTGLPANAEWVGNTTVDQTWNGTEWTPSTEGHHQSVSTTGCVFVCKTNYNWSNGECKSATQNGECTGLPANGVWNTASHIQQTWNGADWLPDLDGIYSETASSNQCRFKCKNSNYTWNGTTCEPRTQIVSCGTLPANTTWNTVSQISQTYNGSEYAPAVNLVYDINPSTTECRYTCRENYEPENADDPKTACVAKTRTVECSGLAENAVWWKNNSTASTSINQTWNGSEWLPTAVGNYSADNNSDGCFFKCSENYNWNQTYRRCDPKTQKASCGEPPANAQWNVYDEITQTWSENGWIPSTAGVYNDTPSPNECRFKCNENYTWNGSVCVADTRQTLCSGLPAFASWWNTTVTQTWSGSEWQPDIIEARYSENAVENAGYCYFKCNENYTWNTDSNACVGKTQSADCDDDTLPQNAVWWNGGTVTQTWNGYTWLPTTIGSYKSDGAAGDGCYFMCKDYHYRWNQAYRSCDCADGYFWNGSECTSPCETVANNCGEHSVCKATSVDTYDCECESGYVSENLQCKERRFWGFEDAWEDTSSGRISVDNSAQYHWARSNALGAKTGEFAMCSDDSQSYSNTAEMTVDVNMPEDGVVSFYIKGTQDTTNHDIVFALYLDGESDSDIVLTNRGVIITTGPSWERTGWADWTQHSFPLTAGSHTLKFRYKMRGKRFCIDDLMILPECYSSGAPCIDSSNGLIWSGEQASATWQTAVDYCSSYKETGLSGWKLPDISEVRTLIQNCDKTVTGGICDVNNYVSSDCQCDDPDYQNHYSGYYSKFGSRSDLWSSTESSSDYAWFARFSYGMLMRGLAKSNSEPFRCAKNMCDEGYLWDGTKCVEPCTTSLCSKSYTNSTGSCANDYACECNTGYFWNGSICVSPCDYTDLCNGIPNSNNVCTATAWNKYECGCNSGYAWNGSECVIECSSTSGTPCYDPASGLTWSSKVDGLFSWSDAVDYCEGSTYGGFTDWKLPTISELRTLIQNCAGTIPGGACAVVDTDSASCLSYNDCVSNACRSCSSGNHSKLGDTNVIWSSSIDADDPDTYSWCVDFSMGMIESYQQVSTHKVRCVR